MSSHKLQVQRPSTHVSSGDIFIHGNGNRRSSFGHCRNRAMPLPELPREVWRLIYTHLHPTKRLETATKIQVHVRGRDRRDWFNDDLVAATTPLHPRFNR